MLLNIANLFRNWRIFSMTCTIFFVRAVTYSTYLIWYFVSGFSWKKWRVIYRTEQKTTCKFILKFILCTLFNLSVYFWFITRACTFTWQVLCADNWRIVASRFYHYIWAISSFCNFVDNIVYCYNNIL